MKGYFHQHLRDAIVTNRSRRRFYIEQAGILGRLMSHWLVSSEYILLPIARYLDKRAAPFIEKGIPIIKNDFIDMKFIKAASSKPKYSNVSSRSTNKLLKKSLKEYKKSSANYLRRGDYQSICKATATLLNTIENIEKTSQSHFASVKHIIESIGYAALHAPIYLEQSAGGTKELGDKLIRIQLHFTVSGIYFDKLAQRCHRKGSGIVLNDVPDIPFMTEFSKSTQLFDHIS